MKLFNRAKGKESVEPVESVEQAKSMGNGSKKKFSRSKEIEVIAQNTRKVPFHLIGSELHGYKIISIVPSAVDNSLFVTFECAKCKKNKMVLVQKDKVKNLKCDECGHLVKVIGVLEDSDNSDFESFYVVGNSLYRSLYKKCTNEETRVKDIATMIKKLGHRK